MTSRISMQLLLAWQNKRRCDFWRILPSWMRSEMRSELKLEWLKGRDIWEDLVLDGKKKSETWIGNQNLDCFCLCQEIVKLSPFTKMVVNLLVSQKMDKFWLSGNIFSTRWMSTRYCKTFLVSGIAAPNLATVKFEWQ